MKRYAYILFDLDGTLTDSGPGIFNAVSFALERMGVPALPPETLRRFIGPPLTESFRRFCGFSPETAQEALGYYREYYNDRGIFENSLYPGIPALLDAVRDAGGHLLMATGKPEPYALRIAEHFGIAGFFEVIRGATMDESRIRKDAIIRAALDACGSPDPAKALMVGDREHDVHGAAQNGLDCLGVLYGYGSREELAAAGAKYLAETVAETQSVLIGML